MSAGFDPVGGALARAMPPRISVPHIRGANPARILYLCGFQGGTTFGKSCGNIATVERSFLTVFGQKGTRWRFLTTACRAPIGQIFDPQKWKTASSDET